MDKSGVFVGGAIGAAIAIVIFAVLFISPPESVKPDIIVSNGHGPSTVGETTPLYSKNLSLIEIFEKSEPGVVRVNVQRGETSDTGGVGSGFVFDKQGHIITNEHVIDDARKVVVTFLDGRSYNAEIIGTDEFTDLAVIKVNADLALLHPLSIGDSSNLKVGEPIAAIGNPFGLSGSMTSGIVSQLGRLLPSGSGYSIPDVIQTDAAINPGNSGGPLLNMRGEIVGINTAIQSATGEFTGVGFAIPSQTVAKIIPTLIEDGEYKHPWIGISGRDIDPDLAKVLELPDAVGFLVVTVVEDSPASKAGLIGSDKTIDVDGVNYPMGGDIILSVDGVEVRKIDDILIHLQRAKSVGDEMILEVLRDGRTTNISIILQERPNGN
ncbi:putative periplasmic serine endoprotease DegP protein [Marine Group I thaumarchaeote SCGC RSA3]|uniref:Putative periplasmic serine endoprotease DegP protein n=5 Tax=Marine Group I TaxID=905826 RepID=A0A081RMQ3_9ARCH|nr:putative periplasmic serine endoprotease DegP protein [Marine Group I thaumarchaeote SCGC AAA799-N04]KFM16639.1 putative periplasmic serine endoprotease DegP protein [Marine Group I thaumarchaeote SCGC AAA799-D11]KFM18692.1 putative periplasmic serine endoprotease DegP protein [Marine Group I thaumarchaeote SCGC RSA3]